MNVIYNQHLFYNEHQEVKTRVNHLFPNCKSYQKVKNVLTADSKGVYQGKIFVKDVAQKTDAYAGRGRQVYIPKGPQDFGTAALGIRNICAGDALARDLAETGGPAKHQLSEPQWRKQAQKADAYTQRARDRPDAGPG